MEFSICKHLSRIQFANNAGWMDKFMLCKDRCSEIN